MFIWRCEYPWTDEVMGFPMRCYVQESLEIHGVVDRYIGRVECVVGGWVWSHWLSGGSGFAETVEQARGYLEGYHVEWVGCG